MFLSCSMYYTLPYSFVMFRKITWLCNSALLSHSACNSIHRSILPIWVSFNLYGTVLRRQNYFYSQKYLYLQQSSRNDKFRLFVHMGSQFDLCAIKGRARTETSSKSKVCVGKKATTTIKIIKNRNLGISSFFMEQISKCQ